MISVLIPVFNSQSVIIGFGSDDGDGRDDNDDDDENYENLSGLEWFALQRTLEFVVGCRIWTGSTLLVIVPLPIESPAI